MPSAATDSFEPRAASPKHFARQLLVVIENRLALLMVEVQEERERLLRAILLALGIAVFGFSRDCASIPVTWQSCWSFCWRSAQSVFVRP